MEADGADGDRWKLMTGSYRHGGDRLYIYVALTLLNRGLWSAK